MTLALNEQHTTPGLATESLKQKPLTSGHLYTRTLCLKKHDVTPPLNNAVHIRHPNRGPKASFKALR